MANRKHLLKIQEGIKMIKTKINAIRKANSRRWKQEGDSFYFCTCERIIEILEKLDGGQEIDDDDLLYIKYPFYLFEGDVKKIGEYYYDYYCR